MNISERKTGYVFVIGAPGAGKGNLCGRLGEHDKFNHLSVGDYLRLYAQVLTPADQNPQIAEYLKTYSLVPAELLVQTLKSPLQGMHKNDTATLIDGFPRAVEQCKEFERKVVRHHSCRWNNANTTDRSVSRIWYFTSAVRKRLLVPVS